MTTQATPDFGDIATPVANPLIYPRRAIISVLLNAFQQDSLLSINGVEVPNPYKVVLDSDGNYSTDTVLVIADSFSNERRVTDNRPLLVISRGQFSFSDTTLEAALGPGASPSKSVTDSDNTTFTQRGLTGRTQAAFQDYTSMGITISAYARKHLVADDLANYVSQLLRIFRQEIRDGAHLHRIGSPVVSPVQQLRADSEGALYLCEVTLLVYQTLSWVKSGTATYNAVLAGLTNLSNSPWPKAIGSEPCAEAEPDSLTDAQSDEWNGN